MRRPIIIAFILALVCALALSGILLVQAASTPEVTNKLDIEPASSAGYHFENSGWIIQGTVSGSGYRLDMLAGPNGTGTPCCCIHLPCTIR